MEKQLKVKLFVTLFISTLFIFSFSHFGSSAFTAMVSEKDVFPAGTMVGPVDISGKSMSEAQTMVADQIVKWKSETKLTLGYKELVVPINTDLVHFDQEATFANVQGGQRNLVLASIDTDEIEIIIYSLSTQLDLTDEEILKLKNEILTYGQNLTIVNHEIVLEDIISVDETDVIIHESVIELKGVSVQMQEWIESLSPIMIPAESQVSFMKVLEEKELATLSSEVKSMLASGIYQTILPTNFTIIERHIGQKLAEYAKPGYEARVNQVNHLDFVFSNPNKSAYTIEFNWVYPFLTMQLKGAPFHYKYEIDVVSKDQHLRPRTIIQYSPQLQPGDKTIVEQGENGNLLKVTRKVYGEEEELVREEFIAEDYYAPIERIEVHGLEVTNNNNTQNPTETPSADNDSPSGQGSGEAGESGVENDNGNEGDLEDGNENEGSSDTEREMPEIQPGEDELPKEGDSPKNDKKKKPSLWGKPNEAEK